MGPGGDGGVDGLGNSVCGTDDTCVRNVLLLRRHLHIDEFSQKKMYAQCLGCLYDAVMSAEVN